MEQKLTTQAKLLITISTIAILGIVPFLVFRLIEKNWIMVVIDIIIIIGMALIFIYVYKTNSTKLPSIVLVFLALIGGVLSYYNNPNNAIYWIYPSILITYFIVKPKYGFALNLLVLFIYFPKLIQSTDNYEIAIIIISVFLINVIAYSFAEGKRKQAKELKRLASVDYLTQIGNRRALDEKLRESHRSLRNHDNIISLVILDLDHFKQVNDTHGHLVGDRVLVEVSNLLRAQINATATVFRYGGEEFIVICNGKNADKAFGFAENFRKTVKNNIEVAGKEITISLGVAEYHKGESVDQWIHRVDLALYQAKNQGRDRTIKAN